VPEDDAPLPHPADSVRTDEQGRLRKRFARLRAHAGQPDRLSRRHLLHARSGVLAVRE